MQSRSPWFPSSFTSSPRSSTAFKSSSSSNTKATSSGKEKTLDHGDLSGSNTGQLVLVEYKRRTQKSVLSNCTESNIKLTMN